MDVSDDNLGDWDIVNSSSLESEEEQKQEKEEAPDTTQVEKSEDEVEEKNNIPEDDLAHNRSEDDREEQVNGYVVEDVDPYFIEYSPYYDGSCSSGSDIDVIDEMSLEDGHSHESIFPSLNIALNSSNLEVSITRRPTVATTPEVGSPPPVSPVRREDRSPPPSSFSPLQAAVIVMCLLVIFLAFKSHPNGFKNAFEDMEKRISELETENKELKDHMLAKVDDDKLLMTMEKQISALKDENYKLSVFMQDLIHELEHQTIVFKKDSGTTGETSHQNEIDKLKEQVNILRIDNDELQKQLVRMRYGVYSPRPTQADGSDESQKKESLEGMNEQENSTEILSEEIKHLREKLISEVAKISDWKKSVHILMKGLENHPIEESSDATKSSKPKAQKNKKGNKYEKILQGINDQFAEAVNNIPHFNLSDLVQKYMGVDKKKVKSVFDSVGHFFKKAQEKTKDIFDENIKSDMWNFIGSFRKQWHVLRKSYFEYSKKMQQGHNPRKEHTSGFNGKYVQETYHNTEKNGQNYEKNIPKVEEMARKANDKPSPYDQQDFIHHERPTTERNGQKYERNIPKEEMASETIDIPSTFPRGSFYQKPDILSLIEKVEREIQGEDTISKNSWVFERAAHRSEIRENQKEDEEVNWFLRNKKPTETPDYFSMDENDHESDSYEPKDMFSMN